MLSHTLSFETNRNITNTNWSNKTILVIEDDPLSFWLVKEFLAHTKAGIIHSFNGEGGIKIFIEHDAIDIVLLDIQLPDINGFDVFSELKKANPDIPIIALTACVTPETKDKCEKMGFDAFVMKTFELNALKNAIRSLMI